MLTVLLNKKIERETKTKTSQLTCEMWTNEQETEVVWQTSGVGKRKANSRRGRRIRPRNRELNNQKMCKFVRVRLVQSSSEQVPNVTRQESETKTCRKKEKLGEAKKKIKISRGKPQEYVSSCQRSPDCIDVAWSRNEKSFRPAKEQIPDKG